MSADNFQSLVVGKIDNSIIKRDFVKTDHQNGQKVKKKIKWLYSLGEGTSNIQN